MAWWEHKGSVSRYNRQLKREGLIHRSVCVGFIGNSKVYRDYLVSDWKRGKRPVEKFSLDKEMERG